jgi:hypothetical protein
MITHLDADAVRYEGGRPVAAGDQQLTQPTVTARTAGGVWGLYAVGDHVVVVHPAGAMRGRPDDVRAELEGIVRRAAGQGLEPWLDPLQRMPRPWPPDHPRAGLLKARSLVLNRQHERAPWLQTAELLDHLVADWKAMIPFNRWLEQVP